MKEIKPTTKDNKTISSIYIYENKERLRAYTVFSDNRIFCLVFNYLKNIRIDKTTLTDITDIEKLKEYDNKNYGGIF
jgi:hypothetical protein